MGKRGLRPLKKLYDLTDQIAEPEITPVLEGSCRIQGPVDELHHQHPRTDSATDLPSMFPDEKRYTFLNDNLHLRTKSGTCNMCSAPCSSCMHLNRTASFMESTIDCPFPGNNLERKEDDTCSFIGVDGLLFYENGTCDNSQHAASETSNLWSASSTHDPYTENAESKAMIRASVTCDASDTVDMPSKMSSSAEFEKDLSKKTIVTSRSQSHIASDIGCKTYSSQDEEQRGLECHGDNMSCITAVKDANATFVDHSLEVDRKDVSCSSGSTSSLLAKEIKDEVQVEAASGLDDHKIEANQNNSRSPSIYEKEFSQKNSSVPDPAETSISDKPALADFPPSKSIFRNVQSLCLNPPKEYSSLHVADSKGNPSTQVQVEPSKCSTEIVKSSSRGQLASDSAIGQKFSVVPNCEYSKANCIKSDNSSVALRETDPYLETEIQLENSNAFMEASEMHVSHVQDKQNVGDENAESDGGLDDVKVCDICGDVGREELLATCSRCSDGAEHTYCMRNRLDKIPDGNWLCEECKTSVEAEALKADKSESVSETSKSTCLSNKLGNLVGTFNDKLLPEFNTKMNDQEVRGTVKGLQISQVSSMRHGDNLLYSSVTSKKASASSGGSVGIASPRKKTVLSRESSFKNLEMGEVKRVKMGSSFGGQPANNAPMLSRLQTALGSNSFKDRARLRSPRVQISRSNSLNNSNSRPSPKVTQLTENIPHKLKPNRESTLINSGKKGLIRTMTKFASYKRGNSDLSNIESVGKAQPFLSSECSSGSKQMKERNVSEKKNSSIHDHPSPLASTSVLLSQADLNVAHHNGRLKNTSNLKGPSIGKVSEDGNGAGSKEEKLQFSSKNFGSQSSYGMGNSEDKKPCQISKDDVRASFAANDRSRSKDNEILQRNATQAAETIVRDDKTKDARYDKMKVYPLFSSPKQVVSDGNQILHCQRCNETSHATHLCPVDKLRNDALKPSAELSLKEGIKKSNKDAVETTYIKAGIQKSNRLADKSKEFQLPRVSLSCGVTSKDILSNSSSCSRNLLFPEGSTHGQETVSGLDAEHSQLTDIDTGLITPVDASYVTSASDSNIILSTSDELNVKSSIHTFPDQASVLANQFRASAIPELDFIWQGDFEVKRTGRLPELFHGIQAHLSTCASPKIPEMVTNFPCKVQLEEVPRRSSWPSQFRGSRPEKDNIALYFFAKDIESYEKCYSKLLENMLTNDLALRGNIDGTELLIFPSNTLPANSQCWNMLFFLWGVFRGRRMHCLEPIPGSKQQSCLSILSTDPLVRYLPSPLINNVSNSQKTNSTENQGMKLSGSDRSSKVNEVISSASMDCCPVSSSRIDDLTCNTEVSPLIGNSLYQAASDHKQPSVTSFSVNCSSKNMNQHPYFLLSSCLETNLQSSANMWRPEGNIGVVYMDSTDTAREEVKIAKSPSHVQSKDLHGVEGCQSGKIMEEQKSMRTEAALEDDQQDYLTESNHPSCESRPSMKCANSSVEMARVSNEISKSIDETELWTKRKIHINIEDRREYKKMKPCAEECASINFRDETLSGRTSKNHPLLGTFLNGQQQRDGESEETVKFVSSTAAESCFFSVDLGLGRYTKSDSVINISMNDEDSPQSHVPILQVDPGDNKKSGKQKELSFLFPLPDNSGCRDRLPGPAGDDKQTVLPLLFSLGRNGNQQRLPDPGADSDVTLSLSLGLPSTPKPVIKTEHLMPGEAHVNTSLFLFSGLPDS